MKKAILAIFILMVTLNVFGAFSYSRTYNGQLGGMQFHIYSLNFASVTGGVVLTGLSNAAHADLMNGVSDDSGILYLNCANAACASRVNGSISIESVTSSDTGSLFVIGN